jgi:hypothetical protein
VQSGDPAHVAFIALTLGFLQPIVLATAGTVGVFGLRRLGVNSVTGVIEGLALVVAYGLAITILHPYGTRGLVLTALAAFVLAAAGLVAARNALHAALLADTSADAEATKPAVVEHRLHGGLVAAIVTVVVVIAAVVSVSVALSGPSRRHAPPGDDGNGRIAPHSAAAARSIPPGAGNIGQSPSGTGALAPVTPSQAASAAATIDLTHGIKMTVAPGWTIIHQSQQSADLFNRDQSAALFVVVGGTDEPDIVHESASLINQNIQSAGLTNVQQRPAQPQPLQGKNFQQLLEVDYTANIQTDQGTDQIYGGWVTLYNSTTGGSGLINLYAESYEAFEAALPDAVSMMASMD